MEGSSNKTTILVVVLLLVVFFAYMFFFKGESESETGLTVEASSGITEEIATLLTSLESIKLKDGVFADAIFISLTNFKLDVIPFPTGRPNPFAPIGL